MWHLSGFLLVALLAVPVRTGAVLISVVNNDGPGEGFNDSTPTTPVGGNAGTTLGEQRLIACQHAADIWGSLLESPVPIRVNARFDPLECTATSAFLGLAGPESFFRDFVGAPRSATWYPVALASRLAGTDLDPGHDDIDATFNSAFGTSCPFPRGWYYGLDGNPPASGTDFVTVVLHELGHGLGFVTLVNLSDGSKANGLDDAYMLHLEDHSTGELFPAMSDSQRLLASVNTGDLHWVGANVIAAGGGLIGGRHPSGHVEMYAPSPIKPGSSLMHFSDALSPNQIMEPSYLGPMSTVGLASPLLLDLGWEAGAGTWTPTRTPSATPTPTATPTDAPTASPTTSATSTPEGGSNTLRGRISYYGSDLPVSGAGVQLLGGGDPVTTTDGTGNYAFIDLAAERHEVAPAKIGDLAYGVSSLDAAYVLQAVVEKRSFDLFQSLACDVTGNGDLSALDASRILQLVVHKIDRFPVAEACDSDWAFVPAPDSAPSQSLVTPEISSGGCRPGSIVLDPLVGQVAGQDFRAVLFGDCTGNWRPTSGAGARDQASTTPVVRAGRPRRGRGRHVRIPIYVKSRAGFQALQADLSYDPAALRLIDVRNGTLPPGALAAGNVLEPAGLARIAVAAPEVLAPGTRRLVVRFEALQRPARSVTVRVVDALVDDYPARVPGPR